MREPGAALPCRAGDNEEHVGDLKSSDRDSPMKALTKSRVILDHIAAHGELSVTELAALMGEPRSTVYRLLSALQMLEFVEPAEGRAHFRLGLALFRLGSHALARVDIRAVARPAMERVHDGSEETVVLAVRRDDRAVCIERMDGNWVQSLTLQLGGSLPLHTGAASRAILAFEPSAIVDDYLAQASFPRLTTRSPGSAAEVQVVLEQIRALGYAISDGEVVDGMATIAAPVFDLSGQVCASLAVLGPRPAIVGARIGETIALIRDAAGEVSRALGHHSEASGFVPDGRLNRRA